MDSLIESEDQFGAHNYKPLPVVLTRGKGIYVWDTEGNRYTDMMSAYSAVSHGHCHPKLVNVLTQQAATLAVVSRAFYSDKLGAFLKRICEITGLDKALPMNTGSSVSASFRLTNRPSSASCSGSRSASASTSEDETA